tara:strand:- start:573 stop:1052 length:480 start_codon:yes stop_codon:yes gene_type:complete
MSSTLFVDAIEPNLSSGVHIAGHVIQVVQATSQTGVIISSGANTWIDVFPSAVITPKSSSSKILVSHSAGGILAGADTASLRLLRGGSVIWSCSRYGYAELATYSSIPWQCEYLDSPASSSSITYTFQIRTQTAGNLRHNDVHNSEPPTATTTLMEIAQ